MDNSKQNIGLTTTVSSINAEQQSCITRDLPAANGTLVVSAGGVLKHFTEMPAVCLLVDIIGFGRLLEEKAASSIAMESFIFFETCLITFKPVGFPMMKIKSLRKIL